MKIQSMFQKDIDRDINGVIKVSQDDQQSLKQELSEYIITKELRRHFTTFFDHYVNAIDNPTDKIGSLPENALLPSLQQRGGRQTRL